MPYLRYACRALLKTPLVTVVAALSLALGIGANAAIFSLFDAVLVRPLPVTRPGELVNLSAPGPKPGSVSCNDAGNCDTVFSYPMFRDLERQQTSFTGIAAHDAVPVNLSHDGSTANARGELVSGSYFSVLGLSPAAGRLFVPSDDDVLDAPRAVVLSFDYWQTAFGSAPDAIGRSMVVNGQSLTVVGVAPKGFSGTTIGSQPDVFVPLTLRGISGRPVENYASRTTYWLYVFARLEPGVTIAAAGTALDGRYHALLNGVEAPLQQHMSDATMARFRAKPVLLTPGARGQSNMDEHARTPILMLFGLTGVVLLIACANIANLLLAQGAARARGMAIRLSIGATRRHLVGQLLLESCLLALVGGAAGLVVAQGTLTGIMALLPADQTSTLHASVDGTVFVFAALLSLSTAVLFGLFPALQSTRPSLVSTLKDQAGQVPGTRSARWFRSSLVSAQVALSTMLLIAAALFARSLVNVSRVDLGIHIDHLVTFSLSPRLNGYTPDRTRILFAQLEDALAALPGARGVASSTVPLLTGSNWGTSVSVEGFQVGPDTDTDSSLTEIGPHFFETLAIPRVAGREFTAADTLGAPKVAVVNRAFAKKFNLGSHAVGTRMRQGGPAGTMDTEIVGLVEDAKYSDVKDRIPPTMYVPYRQEPRLGDLTFYIRAFADPAIVENAIRGVVARFDPNLPVTSVHTMSEVVHDNVFLDRMLTTLSTAFAVLATLLAGIGLYGVLAYTVSRRTREFGLRMALGSAPGGVCRLVLMYVLKLTLAGGLVGVALSLALGPSFASLLYELQGRDPIAILASLVFVSAVAFVAGLVPAIRASRVDPMRALRYE